MGALCCCFKKNDYYDDEYSESRRILDNPVGINDGDRRDSHSVNVGFGNQNYGSTQANGPRQDDDNNQNRLYNRVLDQLSARVIDISSIDKTGEQADLTDREQTIRQKLATVRKSVIIDSNKPQPITRPDYTNFKPKEPISMEDYRLITNIAIKSASAVDHGFRIHNAEPFVVNFTDS